MFAASSKHSSVRSSGPRPCSVSKTSSTSKVLPTACPSGLSISVMSAAARLPESFAISTISSASVIASSVVFIKAPLPVFTSSKIRSAPEAIFLLMMLEAMSGTLSTVPVTSRSA